MDQDETIVASARAMTLSEPERARVDASLAGTYIGRYIVLSRLGAGGMGVVYAAYDPVLDRKVALKLLNLHYSSDHTASMRLQREAQALARLEHQNVVSVHDVGLHEGGQLFVAMEFVAGQTLGAWLRAAPRPRPWRELRRVFFEAGEGLAAAHEAGLVHRDFKPENVMIGDDGRVRVMDFGLARAESEGVSDTQHETRDDEHALVAVLDSELTTTGALLGTPAYMAAEQLERRPADARSDQFSYYSTLALRPLEMTQLSKIRAAPASARPREQNHARSRARTQRASAQVSCSLERRVLGARERLRLALEPHAGRVVAAVVKLEQLERDLAIEHRVVGRVEQLGFVPCEVVGPGPEVRLPPTRCGSEQRGFSEEHSLGEGARTRPRSPTRSSTARPRRRAPDDVAARSFTLVERRRSSEFDCGARARGASLSYELHASCGDALSSAQRARLWSRRRGDILGYRG